MLVLGDAHAEEPEKRETLRSIYERASADVALQVGDLQWYDLPVPTWFVAGNDEDLDVIESMRAGESPPGVENAHLLASTAVDVGGLRVAGLSGNFAPTKYDLPRSELSGDRRRHFTHEDVETAKGLAAKPPGDEVAEADHPVDVFLTHEAPTGLLSYGYDPGCEHVDEILAAVDPALCLVGHHHRHREAEIDGTRVVSLAPAWERYYELDPTHLTLIVHEIDGE